MSESAKNLDRNLMDKNKKEMEFFEEDKALDELDVSFYDVWPQIWKGCLANGLAFFTGVNTGFSTVFITQLMADPNIKEFSKTEASWIASLAVLSGPVGAFSIGPIMDKIGRKKAIIIANIFPILCWGLTYCVTDSIWPLYVARTIGGASGAMTGSVGGYITEISHPKVRDVMMILIGAFVSLGTLVTMILGSYIEWHDAALSLTAMSAVSFLLSLSLPESPLWLVSFKPSPPRLNKAVALSKYFNRSDTLYQKDSERLRDTYSRAESRKPDSTKENKSITRWLSKNIELFQERGVYRPMLILLCIFFFWAFSGVFVVLMYSANIFKATGSRFGNGFDEYTATVMLGSAKLIMTFVSALMSVRFGRRILLMASGSGMASCIAAAGAFQSFSNSKLDFSKSTDTSPVVEDDFQKVVSLCTVVLLIGYILFGSLAMTNLPWALLNELLPTEARAIGVSVVTAYSSLVMFVVLKWTPLVLDYISLSTLFFAFGLVSLLSVVYTYYKVPETLGKNFQEIEKYFIQETEYDDTTTEKCLKA